MTGGVPALSFDRAERIMFVCLAGLRLETDQQVDQMFDAIEQFWTHECGGQKVFAVIDYTNFSFALSLTESYARQVKYAVVTYTIATVRYTTDVSTRANLRAVAVKSHLPSNLYATREDAISVVRELRASQIR